MLVLKGGKLRGRENARNYVDPEHTEDDDGDYDLAQTGNTYKRLVKIVTGDKIEHQHRVTDNKIVDAERQFTFPIQRFYAYKDYKYSSIEKRENQNLLTLISLSRI